MGMNRAWLKQLGQGILAIFVVTNLFMFATSKWNSDKMPGISQWRILSVLTGSMSPTIDAGDMVIVTKYNGEQPQVGDIVTYWQDESERSLVTHRVIQRLENGYLQTRGDANHEADGGWTNPTYIVGKVVFTLPYASTLQTFFQRPIVLGALLLLFIALSYEKWRRQNKHASIKTGTVEGEIS